MKNLYDDDAFRMMLEEKSERDQGPLDDSWIYRHSLTLALTCLLLIALGVRAVAALSP